MTTSQLLDEIIATEKLRQNFRSNFTLLNQQSYFSSNLHDNNSLSNNTIVYLDSGATSLRPQAVIEDFCKKASSYVSMDRSSGKLANLTQELYDQAKTEFVHYFEPNFNKEQLVFTNNATDSLNIISDVLFSYYQKQYFARKKIKHINFDFNNSSSDCGKYYIVLATSNHHANLLPWQKLTTIPNLEIFMIPLLPNGSLNLNAFEEFLQQYGKYCLITSVSSVVNVNGIVNDIKTIKSLLNQYATDCLFCVDHAQGSTFNVKYHQKIFGEELNSDSQWKADFLVGSLHKMYGLTGLGYIIISSRLQKLITDQTNHNNQLLRSIDFYNKIVGYGKLSEYNNAKNENIENNNKSTKVEDSLMPLFSNFNVNDKSIKLEMSRLGGGHVNNVKYDLNTHQFNIVYHNPCNPFDSSGTSNLNTILSIPSLFTWYKKYNWTDLDYATKLIRQYIIETLSGFPGVKNLFDHPNPTTIIEQDVDDLENDTSIPLITYILPTDSHHILLAFNEGQEDEVVKFLTNQGFIVRVGRHCCHPLHQALKLDSTLRITLSPFNNFSDAYLFCKSMLTIINDSLKYNQSQVLEHNIAFKLEHQPQYKKYITKQ